MIIIITMITTMMIIIIITMITTMIIITIREPQYFIPTSSSFAPGSLPKRLLPTEDIFKVVVVTVMVIFYDDDDDFDDESYVLF